MALALLVVGILCLVTGMYGQTIGNRLGLKTYSDYYDTPRWKHAAQRQERIQRWYGWSIGVLCILGGIISYWIPAALNSLVRGISLLGILAFLGYLWTIKKAEQEP